MTEAISHNAYSQQEFSMLDQSGGWVNIYKPVGISSARAVSLLKRFFKGKKIGHAGTLDLEAQGVLPIAVGEATKLISILMDARKTYRFTVQFGAKTDTADASGKIIAETSYRPKDFDECNLICSRFLGRITQTPPAYSALKINGKRAYDLARSGKEFVIEPRNIDILQLYCEGYSPESSRATYVCECSKGTYIRTLAEDISLSLQSLGFVVELHRLQVGCFTSDDSLYLEESFFQNSHQSQADQIKDKYLKMEYVLDDIPVLTANSMQVQQIRYGQICRFENANIGFNENATLLWIKNPSGNIVAIGKMQAGIFTSSRVFNI